MTLLADLTTLRLGGPAAGVIDAGTDDRLVGEVEALDAAGTPALVIGGGSNIVAGDGGFPGVVVRVLTRGVEIGHSGAASTVTVAAGEPWDALVARLVDEGCAGVEALSGIPGMTGATPIQNVGAYGQEIADVLTAVRVLDRARGRVEVLDATDLGFGYRTSTFKRDPGRWVVLAVTLELERSGLGRPVTYPELARALGIGVGQRAPVAAVRAAVLALRARKGMVLDPSDPDTVSAGSFFTNPVLDAAEWEQLLARARAVLGEAAVPPRFAADAGRSKTSAAWLIERAGFHRGTGDPHGIAISGKHTLALTNRGRGTTGELLALAHRIVAAVEARFGVRLVPEPVFVGCEWSAGSSAEA